MSSSRRRTTRDSSAPRVPWLYAVVRDTTAQSEGLAVVLLLSMVLLGTTTVLLVGGTALTDSRQNVQSSQAEHAMRQLDAGASAVAFENADQSTVDLGVAAGDGSLQSTERGWMRVEIQNASTDYADPNTSVLNVSLGSLVYESGETTVAYEGGGVWRSDGGTTTMVARPEFHFRNGTLTVPIMSLTESNSLYEEVEVVESAPFQRWYPNATAGRPHKISNAKVVVTVQSEYYEAWGQYFEAETNGFVSYDHARETVSVKFLSVPQTITLADGIVATAGTGELALAGNGAYTDSYNSSIGPYNVSNGSNGDVWAAGNVTMVGSSAVKGDIHSGDTVNLSGTSDVDGDVYWTEAFYPSGATVLGNDTQIPGVATIEPIDGHVKRTVNDIRQNNDNDATALIQDNKVDFDGADSGTLTAGTYYFEDLSLYGETLTLDTTDGNITIAVRDYVRVDRGGQGNEGATLKVKGNNTVHVYAASEKEVTITTSENNALDRDRDLNLYVAPDALVEVPEDRSGQLRIFGTSDFSMAIAANQGKPAAFYGLVYAPAGYHGSGEVFIKQAEVAGAVITGSMTLGQYGAVHYDEALEKVGVPRSPTASRLEYLHVGHHQMAIREV
ncbi:hypothetical protein ACH9L7_17780 (plasmid) [Haloferax sp. S1W]|uniref:DUF7289 family protein n=1 Tax=Haloferax sp. S1W TaxID=3377110 RepID=UPI0037C7A6AB